MDGRETSAKELAVKDLSQKVKRSGFITQSVAMRKKKQLPSHLCDGRLKVQYHPALFGEIVCKPDIVITDEKMYLHTTVGQLRQLPENTGEPFGYSYQ